jgi:hypothetical protein
MEKWVDGCRKRYPSIHRCPARARLSIVVPDSPCPGIRIETFEGKRGLPLLHKSGGYMAKIPFVQLPGEAELRLMSIYRLQARTAPGAPEMLGKSRQPLKCDLPCAAGRFWVRLDLETWTTGMRRNVIFVSVSNTGPRVLQPKVFSSPGPNH